MSGGSFRKFGTESNGISGTACCACGTAARRTITAIKRRFTGTSIDCSDLLAGCSALCRRRLECQVLAAPVGKLCDVDLVLAGAGDLVNPAELLGLMSRFSQPAEHLAVGDRELV